MGRPGLRDQGSVPMRPRADGFDAGRARRADARRRPRAHRRPRRRPRRAGRGRGWRLHRPGAGGGLPRCADSTSPSSTAPPRPSARSTPTSGTFIAEAVAQMGITLVLGDGADHVETGSDGRARAVVTSSGRRLPADLVVLGLGVRPNTALAQAAGIPLGPSGGVAVDARMRTRAPGLGRRRLRRERPPAVGAAGRRRPRHRRQQAGSGRRTSTSEAATPRSPAWSARRGHQAVRARGRPYRPDQRPRSDGGRLRLRDGHHRLPPAGELSPGGKPSRSTAAGTAHGRLLGAQLVGREGAAKRIDVLATALWTPG